MWARIGNPRDRVLDFFDKNGKSTTVLKEVVSLSFRIFTWGINPNTVEYKKINGSKDFDKEVINLKSKPGIKVSSFKSNYYGYIEIH